MEILSDRHISVLLFDFSGSAVARSWKKLSNRHDCNNAELSEAFGRLLQSYDTATEKFRDNDSDTGSESN